MEIRGAGKRAAALTRQMLRFVRSEAPELKAFDLREIYRGLQALLQQLLGDLQVEWEFEGGPLWVTGDPSAYEQVLLNLCVNARDASPARSRLRISLKREPGFTGAIQGRNLQVSVATLVVSDQGPGISPEILPRIFEAGFSTKEASRGTGMGLDAVARILTESGGGLAVDSRLGSGTIFRAAWPLAENVPDSPSLTSHPSETTNSQLIATDPEGLLLVVSEAHETRRAAMASAAACGISVLGASHVDQARLRLQHARIAGLLLDTRMPNSAEFRREYEARFPHGWVAEFDLQAAPGTRPADLMPPFDWVSLAKALDESHERVL
jgi:hypothetical protein